MPEDTKQQYGFFVPNLNVFMYIEATREEFEKILQEYSLEPKPSNKKESKQTQLEQFDDFEAIVEKVSKAPDPPESL